MVENFVDVFHTIKIYDALSSYFLRPMIHIKSDLLYIIKGI